MKKFGPALLIVLFVGVANWPALWDGFVWDDTALVLRDPLIRSPRLIPEGFRHFLFTDATASDFYRPIQRLTYTLEYCAFAVNPMAYHLTSIACHAAAAVALWLLAGEILRAFAIDRRDTRWATFLAALAWAVHPVHNAAVDYVAGRADSLAAFFGFLAFYFALGSRRAPKRWPWLVSATALFLLSGLSKESGLIFPVLWLSLVFLRRNWKALGPWALVSAAMVCVYLSLRLSAEHIPPPTLHAPAPLLVRPIVAARAFAEYAGLIVAPVQLHMERDVETRPTGYNGASVTAAAWRELQTLLGLLLLGAVLAWAVRVRRDQPDVFAFLVLAALAYLPISGLIALNATIAEHWLYLPSAFLLLAVSIAISHLAAKPPACRLILALACVWICGLAVRTFIRASDWKDQQNFFQRTIASGGDTARMLINLAGVEMNSGDLIGAQKHLRLALAKDPDQPLAIVNLAAVAVKQRDFESAHGWLERAEKMPLVEAQAQELHAVLSKAESDLVDLPRLRLAAHTGRSSWQIEKRYVRVLAESGDLPAAVTELEQVLHDQWYRAESWQLLAELFAKGGLPDQSAAAMQRARECDVHLSLRPKVL